MGQAQSDERHASRTHEELVRELANKFADKCFTPLELYSLKDNFRSLADQQDNIRYLKEETVARFLEIPDVLGASPVIFHMISYLGAFPFLQDAPAVLGLEQLVIVITLMTERYKRVLAKGASDRRKLLFKSLAVHDRKMHEVARAHAEEKGYKEEGVRQQTSSNALGFAVVAAGEEAEGDDEDDDELVLAAFDSLDIIDAFRQGGRPTVHGAMIPADNFRKLVILLLLISPLDAQESLSRYSDRVIGAEIEMLRSTAESILAAFVDVEKSPGIAFGLFNRILPVSFPFLFDGFNALFEHFLFSKNLDLNKHKNEKPKAPAVPAEQVQPLLPVIGSILNMNVLSQLSFFLPGSSLFRCLRLLYSGEEDGFSMGSFETKVFNWQAPTILLVRGSPIDEAATGGPESVFNSTLPQRRLSRGSGRSRSDTLTFGIYIDQPWRHSNKECFGGPTCVLFQLKPVHDVFPASTLNRDYAYFTRSSASTQHAGLAFGCPPPRSTGSYRPSSTAALGPVSLRLDSSFEFGVFTHDYTSGGGAFAASSGRRRDFQERFAVDSLEVWGCGGDTEAKAQAEHWAWEAREAEARRRVNLGTGNIEADRALLEMAGLIGGNRSGGSMG